MDISEWIAAGRPLTTAMEGMGWDTKAVQRPPPGKWGIPCYCNPALEMGTDLAGQQAWYRACPSCKNQRDQIERATGGVYSASLSGFVGMGVDAPDAKRITPPPFPASVHVVAPQVASPARSIDATMKTAPTPVPTIGAPMKTKYASLGAGLGTIVPGVGTVTGGAVGGLLDLFGGVGKSKCPGPYNYNPSTGGCDPKPGAFVGGGSHTDACPQGTTFDPSTGQCKVGGLKGAIQRGLPGGQTGYVDPTGFSPTQAYGLQGFVPQSIPTSRLVCPSGYVLYGKQPGMEVCLPKGFLPNKHRKWPKAPRPAMTAQDVKTLNRINAIQRKVSNMAVKAGYKKPTKR